MGKKINELTEITEVPSSSYILVDDGNLNNKVTKENLMKDYLPLTGGTISGNLAVTGTIKDGSSYLAFADGTDLIIGSSDAEMTTINASTTMVGGSVNLMAEDSMMLGVMNTEKGAKGPLEILCSNLTIANSGTITTTATSFEAANTPTTVSEIKAHRFISRNSCSCSAGNNGAAFGVGTASFGQGSITAGVQCAAGGNYTSAFGYGSNKLLRVVSDYTQDTTTGSLEKAWKSNKFCLAHGKYSFVCGKDNLALGESMHIEGESNYGYSKYGHIEGYNNYAANIPGIHIEGENNSASGSYIHVEGSGNKASGSYSHVGGYKNVGSGCQYVFGHYNKSYTGSSANNTSSYSSLIIGNGTSSTTSNCFRVDNSGGVFGLAAYSSTGADYAEYFEWQDGNINKEDRRGYFVTLDGEKIRIAKTGEYILGIVSANPAVIGNNDMQWQGHYLFDEFGSHIIEKKTIINEDGEEEEVELLAINPELDTEREYVHRSERPEWDTVGMLGVLAVHDDGTCKVNGFCECNENGIATASETGYRVIKRVNDHIVKVLFR